MKRLSAPLLIVASLAAGFCALLIPACATSPNISKLQQMQANAQLDVNLACAVADGIGADLDKVTATNIANACMLAQQLAATTTAALAAAQAAQAASAPTK